MSAQEILESLTQIVGIDPLSEACDGSCNGKCPACLKLALAKKAKAALEIEDEGEDEDDDLATYEAADGSCGSKKGKKKKRKIEIEVEVSDTYDDEEDDEDEEDEEDGDDGEDYGMGMGMRSSHMDLVRSMREAALLPPRNRLHESRDAVSAVEEMLSGESGRGRKGRHLSEAMVTQGMLTMLADALLASPRFEKLISMYQRRFGGDEGDIERVREVFLPYIEMVLPFALEDLGMNVNRALVVQGKRAARAFYAGRFGDEE